MKTAPVDILGLGVATVDDLLTVDLFPQPNEKILVRRFERQGGGLTASALVAASRLGCSCHMVTPLRDDDLSVFLRDTLTREGLVLHEFAGKEGCFPFHSTILIESKSGERIILCDDYDRFEYVVGDVAERLLPTAKCLFVDHVYADVLVEAAELARRLGVPVVGDFERDSRDSLALMQLVDHLILPLAYARQHTGKESPEDAVMTILGSERAVACVTDSANGCWFAERGGKVQYLPAFKVEEIVDSTGCGDVFHGVYASALVQGYPVAERMRRAAAAAAIKLGRPGAQNGAPISAELDEFLRRQ